jgi:hypothetical protein
MPLTHYICPDNARIPCGDCIAKCRMRKRCLTRNTLYAIFKGERAWDGTPHVTQLLNGTMHSYLTITQDYAIKPKSRAFALLGSTHHKLLENDQLPGTYTELHFKCDVFQGTVDLIEYEDDTWRLYDNKTWGSYKVAKSIGLVKQGGGRGGPPATFHRDISKVDLTEAILQLNAYRYMFEKHFPGQKVGELAIQCTVRDGGVQVATSRGVDDVMYMIPVPFITNTQLLDYYLPKRNALIAALSNHKPEPCSTEENWHGRKCGEYCDVNESCPQFTGIGTTGE